jgi:flagellar hook-associated protein 1
MISIGSSSNNLQQLEKLLEYTTYNIQNEGVEGVTPIQSSLSFDNTSGTLTTKVSINELSKSQLSEVITQTTEVGYWNTLDENLSKVDVYLGDPQTGGILSSGVFDLQRAVRFFSSSPLDGMSSQEVINTSRFLTDKFSTLQNQIVEMRQDVEDKITGDVLVLQQALTDFQKASNYSGSTGSEEYATALTQKTESLKTIANLLPINTFTREGNQMAIQAVNGPTLFFGDSANISFISNSSMTENSRYPTDLNGLVVNGQDITPGLKDGELGALFQLRDQILPNMLEDLRQFEQTLKFKVNEALNKGANYTPQSTLTGTKSVSLADEIRGSGSYFVSIVDDNNKIVKKATINVANQTVQQALNNINGFLGADGTAQVVNGFVQLSTVNPLHGVALHEQTSSLSEGTLNITLYDQNGGQAFTQSFDTTSDTLTNMANTMNTAFNGKAAVSINGNSLDFMGLSNYKMSLNGGPIQSSVNSSEKGISHFFGFQDLFLGESQLYINPVFQNQPANLPFGSVNVNANVGDVALTSHGLAIDNTTSDRPADVLRKVFESQVRFGKSSTLPKSDATLIERTKRILQNIGGQISNASSKNEFSKNQLASSGYLSSKNTGSVQDYLNLSKWQSAYRTQMMVTKEMIQINGLVPSLLSAA